MSSGVAPDWQALARLTPSALRRRLLAETLALARAEVPYYRRAWRGLPLRLEALPVLDKATAIAHQEQLRRGSSEAFVGVISSGTHHREGRLLRVALGDDERGAAQAFAQARGERSSHHAGWVLEVRSAHHGWSSSAAPGRLVAPWTYTAQALRLVEQLLAEPQADGRRVVTMVLGSGALMPLTAWFLDRRVDPRRFGLRGIGTTSFRLAPRWRALVEEVWGCSVHDNFSLSELPGPAFECRTCGFHHWASPPVVTEVLHPVTHAPLRKGTGLLVVTTLAPFVARMPLIRYSTGDLVTLGPKCPLVGEVGFRPRGRLSQALVHPRWGLLVAPLDVSDLLEGRAEVGRHLHPMEQLGLVPMGDCGAVKAELSLTEARGGRLVPRVQVELRFDPYVFADEARALGGALADELLEKSPALRRLERSGGGELEIELLRPGSLKLRWVKH